MDKAWKYNTEPKETRHKRVCAIWFHLYKVQNQAALICTDKSGSDSFGEEEGSDWGWGVSLGCYQRSMSWSEFQLHKHVPCMKVHGNVHLGFMCVMYMYIFSIQMYFKKKNGVLSHRLVMGIKPFHRPKLLRQGMSHSECCVIPRISSALFFFFLY